MEIAEKFGREILMPWLREPFLTTIALGLTIISKFEWRFSQGFLRAYE
jgi:hypothetical protein